MKCQCHARHQANGIKVAAAVNVGNQSASVSGGWLSSVKMLAGMLKYQPPSLSDRINAIISRTQSCQSRRIAKMLVAR